MSQLIPQHVAIIMDGNGRWAQTRGYGRTWGHREGAKRVDDIVTECCRLGVRFLSLYVFSTENWNRPLHEVSMLMRLLAQHLRIMDKKLVRNEVQLVMQGSVDRLPKFVQTELKRVARLTAFAQPKLTLNLCVSYGGRQEILDGVRAIAEEVVQGRCLPEEIDEALFRRHLYQPNIPDPDLLIRTGGEYRVSNFLLWQIAYSELLVVPTLWPDFTASELNEALSTFQHRQRRFGKTSEQIQNEGFGAPPVTRESVVSLL